MNDASEHALPPAAAVSGAAVAEMNQRVAALPGRASRYERLVEFALIQQEPGNRLSQQIYNASQTGSGLKTACKAGCGTCCEHIPSKVRGDSYPYYMLTILDIVTLIENYPAIKQRFPDLPARTAAVIDKARATGATVPCPYLGPAGACGIYEFRPLACKLWFSTSLPQCLRHVEAGYPQPGATPSIDLSNQLRADLEAPVMACTEALLGGAPFGDYDYLTVFHAIARLDSLGQLAALKARIDAGTLGQDNPFETAAAPAADENSRGRDGAGVRPA